MDAIPTAQLLESTVHKPPFTLNSDRDCAVYDSASHIAIHPRYRTFVTVSSMHIQPVTGPPHSNPHA